MKCSKILQGEVRAAMKKMKYEKVAGPDNITIEAVANFDDWGVNSNKNLNLVINNKCIVNVPMLLKAAPKSGDIKFSI